MVQTPSNMVPLGTRAPEFTLPDSVSGKNLSLQDLKGEHATLIMFICNHCPFVIHIQDELVRLGQDYFDKGVGLVAISANDVENYPEDSPAKMKQLATTLGFRFPYLYDESQQVARAYDATCTPDFFIFDKNLLCVYRGQLDGSRPGNDIAVSGVDVRQALDAILTGNTISKDQSPSIGCNIKWKN